MRPVMVETNELPLDGFSVFVREAGSLSASPILCLHGGPGLDGSYFFPDPIRFGPGLRELARDYRLVVYDQRGCGRSGTPAVGQPFALSRHVDDIEAIRQSLSLDRPAMLAHSFGTVLGILYALRYPDHVSQLILIGGAPTREFMDGYQDAVREDLPAADRERLANLRSTQFDDEVFRERFRTTLPLYFHRQLDSSERDAFVDAITFSARVNRSIAVDLESYDLTAALPNVRAPTLIIYGESDRVVQPRYQLQFRGHLLTARFVAFFESGHFPFIEEPDAFARVAHYFLSHGNRTLHEGQP